MALICEVAFSASPLDTAPVFTTVGKVIRARIRRGRRANEGGVVPATAEVVIDDPARLLDPTNPASLHAANLVPMRQVRISMVLADASIERLATLYVENWTAVWRPAESTLTCADALAWFATQRLVKPEYAAAVLADAPMAYYRFGEPSGGAVIVDSSPHSRHSGFKNMGISSGSFQSSSPGAVIADPDTACDVSQTGSIALPNSLTPPSWPWTVECFVRQAGAVVADLRLYRMIGSDPGVTTGILLELWLLSTGQVQVRQHNNSTGVDSVLTHPTVVVDDQWHHVVWRHSSSTANELLVDNVSVAANLPASQGYPGLAAIIGVTVGQADAGGLHLDELAIYHSVLSALRIAEHYRVARGRWGAPTVQRSGARVNLVCDIVGWPAALRSIAAGVEDVMTPEVAVGDELNTAAASVHLAQVDAVEGGRLHVRRDGVLVFAARPLATPAPVATYRNDGGGLRFVHAQPARRRADVVNHAEAARIGGATQIVESASSVARLGRHDAPTREGHYGDDNDARWAAARAVHAGKDSVTRLDQLTVNARIGAAEEASCAVRELGDVISVHLTPPSGAAVDLLCAVEGIAHEIDTGRRWSVTYDLSVVVPPQTPMASIIAAPEQPVGSGVPSVVIPAHEYADTANLHSARSTPDRLVIPTAGDWLITGSGQYEGAAAGGMMVYLVAAGQSWAADSSRHNSNYEGGFSATTVMRLAAGDVVQMYAYQTSGAVLAMRFYSAWSPVLSAVKVG